jgi:type II secretory pathway component PulL
VIIAGGMSNTDTTISAIAKLATNIFVRVLIPLCLKIVIRVIELPTNAKMVTTDSSIDIGITNFGGYS